MGPCPGPAGRAGTCAAGGAEDMRGRVGSLGETDAGTSRSGDDSGPPGH